MAKQRGRRSSDAQTGGDNRAQRRGQLPRARSMQRRDERRKRAQAAPRRVARSFVALPQKISLPAVVAVLLVVAFLAVSLTTPLRNYFQQRTELENLKATIAMQEQKKNELTEELNRYNNDNYVKEQARIRLGLVEPGESAYRIISPKIHAHAGSDAPGVGPTEQEKEAAARPWFRKLWDSIAIEPEDAQHDGEETVPAEQLRLPILPDEH